MLQVDGGNTFEMEDEPNGGTLVGFQTTETALLLRAVFKKKKKKSDSEIS